MDANKNTPALYDVVKQFDLIKVDDYQRTYAWTQDEIGELFEDLLDTADAKDLHFFGTLIFQTETSSRAQIVDGQQRLTTIFVIMAALRDAIEKLGLDTLPANEHRKLPVPVINKIWEFLYDENDDSKPRFKSNRFIEETLLKCVFARGKAQQPLKGRENHLTLAFRKGVTEVRRLLNEELAKHHSQIEKLERINELSDTIRDRFVVLQVQTQNLSESLEIFLTLNNRGMPLGPSDLVRGEIISQLCIGEEEAAQSRIHQTVFEEWSEIADDVREPEVFLRHYLVASGTEKVQKKKVYEKVVGRLKDKDPSERKTKARNLWADLQESAAAYKKIADATMGSKETQYHFTMLNGLMKSHRILLLTVVRSKMAVPELEKVSRLLYVLCFKWVMSGGNAQKLEDKFQKFGNEFRDFGNTTKLLENLRETADGISNQLVQAYLEEEVDEGYLVKAILHGINRSRTKGANNLPLDRTLHLEHIAPQTPTEGWQASVFSGDKTLYNYYPTEISKLGNLTLLDERLNMAAKQELFNLKCKTPYDKTSVKITNDLQGLKQWSAVEIENRSTYLVQAFDQTFSTDSNSEPVKEFSAWLKTNGLGSLLKV